MNRILKWIAIVLVGIVILLVVGAIIIRVSKKEILATINLALAESVNGEVTIDDYQITVFHSFPDISITLKDIKVVGRDDKAYHPAFLRAQRVYINLEPFKLFRKELSLKSVDIQHGTISIFRTPAGYTNLNILKKQTDSLSQNKLPWIELNKIKLMDVSVRYQDSLTQKNIGVHFISTENRMVSKDSLMVLDINGKLKFEGVMLNAAKGSYLRNKEVQADIHITLDVSQHHILISRSPLIFDKSTVSISATIPLRTSAGFILDIQSDKLDFDEGLSILPDSLAGKLRKYHIDKPIQLKLLVSEPRHAGSPPAVDVAFAFQDSNATLGKVLMENMSITGAFQNHVDSTHINDDHNSQIKFTAMHGLLNNLPMQAVASLTNLDDPALELKATFDFDLTSLNESLDTAKIKMMAGHFTSAFSYSGKLHEYLDETKSSYEGQLNGEAQVHSGILQYRTKKLTLDNINATFAFNEKRFDIKNLGFQQDKNKLFISGSISDFIPFFTTVEKTGKVNLVITSPSMNISGLAKPRKAEKTKATKRKSKKKIADVVEILSKEVEFDIDFRIKNFVNREFKVSDLDGRLILLNDRFIMKNATMGFANGTVKLNLNLANLQSEVSPFQLKARLQNVGIKEFFHAFGNFNQATFRDDHVDGELTMDINLEAEINNKLEVLTPNLKGDANFKIEDGRLTNFEPLQRLSNFLLKGRDFSDVQFGEITSEISINGTTIDIARMEIGSTALSMFIEGRYDLKDSADLSIQIPLSNLKKRDQDFPPENIGVDAKAGASVFLRVRPDKNGKMVIAYDPLKRFRKKR